jgi:hypothetical protein
MNCPAKLLIAAGDVEVRERLNEGLPTAGLAVIDFPINDWRKGVPIADGSSVRQPALALV